MQLTGDAVNFEVKTTDIILNLQRVSVVILLLGEGTILKWAVILLFRWNLLPPFSGSKCLGRVSVQIR
jgi:hypothetical protein